MANVVIEVRPAHIDMTGTAFMVYANHYRKAALACLAARPTVGFDPAPYFLLCLSLELHLKSFIWLKDGIGPQAIKNLYMHKIDKLWRDSKKKGIGKYVKKTPLRDLVIALVGPTTRTGSSIT